MAATRERNCTQTPRNALLPFMLPLTWSGYVEVLRGIIDAPSAPRVASGHSTSAAAATAVSGRSLGPQRNPVAAAAAAFAAAAAAATSETVDPTPSAAPSESGTVASRMNVVSCVDVLAAQDEATVAHSMHRASREPAASICMSGRYCVRPRSSSVYYAARQPSANAKLPSLAPPRGHTASGSSHSQNSDIGAPLPLPEHDAAAGTSMTKEVAQRRVHRKRQQQQRLHSQPSVFQAVQQQQRPQHQRQYHLIYRHYTYGATRCERQHWIGSPASHRRGENHVEEDKRREHVQYESERNSSQAVLSIGTNQLKSVGLAASLSLGSILRFSPARHRLTRRRCVWTLALLTVLLQASVSISSGFLGTIGPEASGSDKKRLPTTKTVANVIFNRCLTSENLLCHQDSLTPSISPAAASETTSGIKPVNSTLGRRAALMYDFYAPRAKASSPSAGKDAKLFQHNNPKFIPANENSGCFSPEKGEVQASTGAEGTQAESSLTPSEQHLARDSLARPSNAAVGGSAATVGVKRSSRGVRNTSRLPPLQRRPASAETTGAGYQQETHEKGPQKQRPKNCQHLRQQRQPTDGRPVTQQGHSHHVRYLDGTAPTGKGVHTRALSLVVQHANSGFLANERHRRLPGLSTDPSAVGSERTDEAAATHLSAGGAEAGSSLAEVKALPDGLVATTKSPTERHVGQHASLTQPEEVERSTFLAQQRVSFRRTRSGPLCSPALPSRALDPPNMTSCNSGDACDVNELRLPFVTVHTTGPIYNTPRQDARGFMYEDDSVKIQSPPGENEKRVVQQLNGPKQVQQQDHQQRDQEERGQQLSRKGYTLGRRGPRLRLQRDSSQRTGTAPVVITRIASPTRRFLARGARVVGNAYRRSLQVIEDEGGRNEKHSAETLGIDEIQGEVGEPASTNGRVETESPTSAGARHATPSASTADHGSNVKSEAGSTDDESGLSHFLEQQITKNSLPSIEQRRYVAGSTKRHVVQKISVLATAKANAGTTNDMQQQLLQKREVAGRRSVSSIPALRELLEELSVASRKRRQEAADKGDASGGEAVAAASLPMRMATCSSLEDVHPSSETLTGDQAAPTAHLGQRSEKFLHAATPSSGHMLKTVVPIAAAQATAASDLGSEDGRLRVEAEAGASVQRKEDREEQLWDMESAEEAEDIAEQSDGDESIEEGRTEFIQQQEDEAARRTKMKTNSSVIPVLSAGFTDVATSATSADTTQGSTAPPAVTYTGAEPLETSVMKKMWETREQLSVLAKKKLRTFNSAATRRQVCGLIQSDQLQYKLWFTLASLFVIEWPFYSYAEGGGLHFLGELLEQTRTFAAPPGSSPAVHQRYEDFRACKMPAALEEGIPVDFMLLLLLILQLLTLKDCLPSGAELPAALAAASEHAAFAKLVRALGDVHVPLDNHHSLAHVFDIVEAAMGLAWGKNFFIGKTITTSSSFKPFTAEELFDKYTYAFSQSRRYFSMTILLFRAMRQHVTQKGAMPPAYVSAVFALCDKPHYTRPHTGVILLLVEQPESPHSKMNPFHQLQDFRILQAQIRQSVLMKLESALMRFYPSSSRSSSKEMVDLPDIRVSGFFARYGDGRTVEKGLVGVEIDFSLIERFKQETPRFGVMIQVNLLDTWADKNSPEAWPDVLEPYNNVLSAYTATQLLKSELLWDPSLASLAWGRTKFVYSSISEVFEYEKARGGGAPPYDPDLHVMLLQSYKDFVNLGREEGVMEHLVKALQRKPLGHARIPRTFEAERVTLQGSAMLLTQVPIRRTENELTEGSEVAEGKETPHLSAVAATAGSTTAPLLNSALSSVPAVKPGGFESDKTTTTAPPWGVVRQPLVGDVRGTSAIEWHRKDANQDRRVWQDREKKEEPESEGKWRIAGTGGRSSEEGGVGDHGQGENHSGEKRQLYRKKQFGAGLNYGEVLQLEKAIRENTIMLHIKIKGLGHTAAEEWQSLRAHEILNRLAQRLRGAFEIHYVEAAKPRPTPAPPLRCTHCDGVVPYWVLALSICATVGFFICCLVLQVHHNNLDLPWWLSCVCSRSSPWEKELTDVRGSPSASTGDDENNVASPAHLATTSAMTGSAAKTLSFMKQTSPRNTAASVTSSVAALVPAPIEAAWESKRDQGRRVSGRRYLKKNFSERRRILRGNSASLVSGRESALKKWSEYSTELSPVKESTVFCKYSSDASKPVDTFALRAKKQLGRPSLNSQESSASSCFIQGESNGSSLSTQGVSAKVAPVQRRSERFKCGPRFPSPEHGDAMVLGPHQPHTGQAEHTKGQRLRQEAQRDAILPAYRAIQRITRVSRMVLEDSICSPAEMAGARAPTAAVTTPFVSTQRRDRSVPPALYRAVAPNASGGSIGCSANTG